MHHLGVAVGPAVGIEVDAGAVAQVAEAGQVADRRVEPDVEVLAGLAGDLEAEVRRIARDVPVLQAGGEPFLELVDDARLQVVCREPVAQQAFEIGQPEEQVLGFAQFGGGAGKRGDGVDQIGRRVGCPADLAAVAVLVGRLAARAGTTNEAIGQEHALDRVVGLPDGAPLDVTTIAQPLVDVCRNGAILGRMRRMVIIESNVETGEVASMLGADPLDELLRADAFLFGLEHDGRAMRIVSTHVVTFVTTHLLEPDPDVGLDVLDQVADVDRSVGIRQRAGDQDPATVIGHGVSKKPAEN